MRGLLVVSLVFGGSLVVGGCTLVNAPSEHLSEPVSTAEFCDALGAEFCRGFVECCEFAPAGYDVGACVARRTSQCRTAAAELLDDPRTGYDPDVAGATLSRARAYVDACDPAFLSWYGSRDGLYAPLLGTVEAGGVCSASVMPTIAAFFACVDDDLTCRFSATNWTCSARVPMGEACTTIFDCEEGLFCEGLDRLGVCRPRRADGRPCDELDENGADECQSGVCFEGVCLTPTAQELYCSLGG